MTNWLDFNKQEKGYKPFVLTKKSVSENLGKRIVYLRKQDTDQHRGYCFPRYGILKGTHYKSLILENDSIFIPDIIECGIEIGE